jgi:hypothetical protein
MKKCLKCENTFPNRIVIEGKERFLNKRKMLYNERHKKDKRLNGIYAKKILWS